MDHCWTAQAKPSGSRAAPLSPCRISQDLFSSKRRRLSDQLLIRTIEKRDFAQWKVLWDGYNAFYGRKGPTALPDTVIDMTWSRSLTVMNQCKPWSRRNRDSSLAWRISSFIAVRFPLSPSATCKTYSRSKLLEAREWGAR